MQASLRRLAQWLANALPSVSIKPDAMRQPGRKLVLNGRILHIHLP